MNPSDSFTLRAARWLAFASAVSIMLGIAPSQILLGLALAALMLSGEKLRFPPIKLPLALFWVGTLLALAFSGNPTAGLPQVRKLYLFVGVLLVVFSLLRDMVLIRWLFLTWAVLGSITAIRGVVQFKDKVEQAHNLGRDFYSYYVGERITGFTSHWNTFSAEQMFALIMILAFLFFAANGRRQSWVWMLSAVLTGLAIVLAETRGVWIATGAAGLYLVWFWRRWLVVLVPVAVAAGFFLAPAALQQRFTSILHPSPVDSNEFRKVTRRTGMRMIAAHPLLGLGPEMPRIHFDEYVPADVVQKPEGSYIHLHNIYLEYAAERGIPVLLIFLWLIGKILWDFWRGLRALPPGPSDRRFVLHGAIAVVVATLVEGVVEYNLGDSEVLTMFLVVVACGYLAIEKDLANA
jgi:putative inorganic carbon (HCO3(-)) transporter